ncbi:MAG: EamA family transporter [Desulfobulbus propionicus]|nr:MAG: EamA family transporter [Desulfobulbus propionicus]
MQQKKDHHFFSDLLLLLTAMVWGFGFVAQRVGMEHLGPYSFNGFRFLLAGLCLIPLALLLRHKDKPALPEGRIHSGLAGSLAGLFLFAGATLQQLGLQFTTAGKAGFITGLYVVLVPIIGLLLHQRTTIGAWLGAILATIGLYLLSVRGINNISYGDLLELVGTIFWALHVLTLGYLSPRTAPIQLAIVQFFVCGLLSLGVAAVTESITSAGIRGAILPVLYGGCVSVGVGYTLQVLVQRRAHPAHAAILLSLESPFAAFGGWWLLGEHLSLRGVIGCCLMLLGMLTSQLWPFLSQQTSVPDRRSAR